jgi:hypothetical protein
MREILVKYVTAYRRAGAAATMQYADQADPLRLEREFVSLVEDSNPGELQPFPALRRHLVEYPAIDAAATTDVVYWSKERVGRKGVVSVTHVAVSRAASSSPADYAIASKHIYGSHYYDASLGLTILLRDRATTSPAIYLVYVNRSRVDAFSGVFGRLTRKIVSSKARSTVAERLARMQQTLERQFAAVQSY